MSKKTTLVFVLFGMMTFSTAFGQKSLYKAEELAKNGETIDAITAFENYLIQKPNDYNVMDKLANEYARNGQYGQAIYWYNSVPMSKTMGKDYYVSYGNTLKRVGRYNEATDVFKKMATIDPIDAGERLASCKFAVDALTAAPTYDGDIAPYNSNHSDFGLTFYKGIPIVSSFRNDVLMNENQRRFNKMEPCQRTYSYMPTNNKLSFVNGIDGKLNNVGPINFSNDGKTCAIIESRITDRPTFDFDNKSAALYIAKLNDNGEIVSHLPFEHNEVMSSINAACLAFDGTAIYFSSNRAGGFGGYDIYVSYLENNRWTLPANLGAMINTSGNEITPYFIDNQLLYASDSGLGIGGFDIFSSTANAGEWTLGVNMGNGINSMSDDYFPVLHNGQYFVTSNRLGGKGSNDVYSFTKIKPASPKKDYAANEIPKAVNLEELEKSIASHTVEGNATTLVSNKEIKPKTVNPAATKAKTDVIVNTKTPNNPDNTSNPTTAKNTTTANTKTVDKEAKLNTNLLNTTKSASTVEMTSNVTKESFSPAAMALLGAHRVGVDKKVPDIEVYFIQLASISATKASFSRYKPLVKFGNIYKMMNNKAIKVRLGYFDSKAEAEVVLAKVRASGYADAFITNEILNTARMELVLSSTDEKSFSDEGNFNSKSVDPQIRNFKSNSKYKVRLASYEDPNWFDIEKVKDLGRVEQWTKGTWTIFVLAGYQSIDDAKAAAISANNRGFKTAEVVIDNGGILERIKQN